MVKHSQLTDVHSIDGDADESYRLPRKFTMYYPVEMWVPEPEEEIPMLDLMFYRSLDILTDMQLTMAKIELHACIKEQRGLRSMFKHFARSARDRGEKMELLNQHRITTLRTLFMRSRLSNVQKCIKERIAKRNRENNEVADKPENVEAFEDDQNENGENLDAKKEVENKGEVYIDMFGIVVKTFDAVCSLVRRYYCFGHHHDVQENLLEQGIGVYRNTVICTDWECTFDRPEYWKPPAPLLSVTVD
ncbi:unnamed protein product [Strongylus vulgaris]|uniref:Uncharacterized protein n=1 Tax=Strongylus vulgaris TaxID=40348 RepID=A0A3P7L592_STRVU|nr:unnamed protein product [Strongylus vulgaris]